jgi:predicted NBD/HSP70 family sugar kinase
VFHAIRDKPGVSQSRLRDQTAIDRSTISAVVSNLEKAGFVLRAKETPSAATFGRPEAGLRVNADAGTLLGIVVGPSSVAVNATGLDGAVRASENFQGSVHSRPLNELIQKISHFARDSNPSQSPIVGVGISLAQDEAGSQSAQPSPNRFEILLREEIRRVLATPVALETELNGLALAERRFGVMRGVKNFLVVHGGAQIKGALYLGDQIFRGNSNRAGEIGHVKVVPGGAECSCGAHGCLNAYLSEDALMRRLAEFHYRSRSMRLSEIAAQKNDALVKTVLSEAGSYLGMVLANTMNLLAIREVVLSGNLVLIADAILPAIRKAMSENLLGKDATSVNIVRSAFNQDSSIMASVALALEAFQPLDSGIVIEV